MDELNQITNRLCRTFQRIVERHRKSIMVITKKQLLRKLKESGIGMGKNPNRTFIYYQEKTLIPKLRYRNSKHEILFDSDIFFLIKIIREARQAGIRLLEIKKMPRLITWMQLLERKAERRKSNLKLTDSVEPLVNDFAFLIKKEHPLIKSNKDRLQLVFPDSDMARKISNSILEMIAKKDKLETQEGKKKQMSLVFSGNLKETVTN